MSAESLDEVTAAPSASAADERDGLWLHLLLFAFTMLTTSVVGAKLHYLYARGLPLSPIDGETIPLFPMKWMFRHHPEEYLHGLVFSLAILGILLCHEFGHYLACRRHKVPATLPYFLPAPSLIGSFGAFIRILAPFPSRRVLFDVGVAGPIAGFVAALPVTLAGLALSTPAPHAAPSDLELGFPLLMHLMQTVFALPGADGSTIILHPLAVAGWAGMFATALNLLPCGQLDGGHLVHAFAPRAHKWVGRLVIVALLPMAWFCYMGWLLWAVALAFISARRPLVLDDEPLDRRRLWLLACAALILILVFAPAPIAHGSLREESGDLLDAARQAADWLRLHL